MYAEIKTRLLTGIFKVIEIVGNIVCVDNDGYPYDCYFKNGEIVRFCDKKGNDILEIQEK